MPKNNNKKFRRVALEGTTIDGRKITRDQIQQMADNYDPKNKYSARIWLEHLRDLWPRGTFKAYGDVLALKAEESDDGKLGLLAEISPTPDLIALNKERQKVFTSIEFDPDYADTGEAYLVGLAVTDSPASQGTEMLKFSLTSDKFTTAKHLYSEPQECDLTSGEEPESKEQGESLFAQVKNLFSKKDTSDKDKFNDVHRAVLDVAKKTADFKDELQAQKDAFSALSMDFADLKEQLENAEAGTPEPRKLSGGRDTEHHNSGALGDNEQALKTDC